MALHLMEKKKEKKFTKRMLDRLCLEIKKRAGIMYVPALVFKAELAKIYGRINIVYRNKTR